MNTYNFSGFNLSSGAAHISQQYVTPTEDPLFKQYKPGVKDLIPLPKAVLYLLMAALVVVGVAYAIVGHLIKDLAIDIADCVLGPPDDDDKDQNRLKHKPPRHPPPAMSLSHNAFHVWDHDDVIIPLSPDDSPPCSPMRLAAIHYIPSLMFPGSDPHSHVFHHSPDSYSPLSRAPLDYCDSPGPAGTKINIPRDI